MVLAVVLVLHTVARRSQAVVLVLHAVFCCEGQQVIVLKESKQYVQGVCWDPLGKVVVSLSNDRCVHTLCKILQCSTECSITTRTSNSAVTSYSAQCVVVPRAMSPDHRTTSYV